MGRGENCFFTRFFIRRRVRRLSKAATNYLLGGDLGRLGDGFGK